jgi:hypothetical protein
MSCIYICSTFHLTFPSCSWNFDEVLCHLLPSFYNSIVCLYCLHCWVKQLTKKHWFMKYIILIWIDIGRVVWHSCFILMWSWVQILALATVYPDWGFSCFSSVSPGKCQDSALLLGHDRFLPYPFQFIIIHLLLYHRCYIV